MDGYRKAKGVLPSNEGDEAPEDAIRRQRQVLPYNPDDQRGLYRKYIVRKADGSPVSGFYFVLNPKTDFAARVALRAYTRATDNNRLALDIKAWLDEIEGRPGVTSSPP